VLDFFDERVFQTEVLHFAAAADLAGLFHAGTIGGEEDLGGVVAAQAEIHPFRGAGVEKARKICGRCEVKDLCLEYALVEEIEHGVWGGASERERRRIKKRRRDGAA